MHAPIIFILVLSLSACGGSGTPNQAVPGAANAPEPEPAGNQVARLSEGARNAVFIRALIDAGQQCQHVERSVSAGSYQGQPVWRVSCRGGGEWTILIGADGTAQILPEGATIEIGNAQ